MIIVLQVSAPLHMAQGIKETLAMQLEKYGDTKVIEIREEEQGGTQLCINHLLR